MKKLHNDSPSLLAPLQGFWRWLMPAALPRAATVDEIGLGFSVQGLEAPRQCVARPTRAVVRPLRIIRVLDHDSGPANVGRMVISGRMADVCAELDRLVAREQTLH
ncbi:hypothetical protein [Rhodoferax sp. PAMC 29310]|uniref:hypothetical protein n=1 Tax=Rhodoferax sp. PAMC 29310 TaxID=2822760 RepID=UPI001B33EFD8|nr:hypothetical protein [Rhodoferax sp. PAMC 29310]